MKGRVYCLYYPKDENEKIYIGTTTEDKKKPVLRRHKNDYLNWVRKGRNDKGKPLFQLFEKYGEASIKIKLLEEKDVDEKKELKKMQGKWINQSNCLNLRNPARTVEDNEERLKEYRKQYNSNPINKEKRKKYLETHRDEVTQQQADYRIKNASHCPKCGKYVLGGCMKRHNRYNH